MKATVNSIWHVYRSGLRFLNEKKKKKNRKKEKKSKGEVSEEVLRSIN